VSNSHHHERYELLAPLGSGAQARVFLARDRETGRRVAWREEDGAAERFELRAPLSHPSIVRVEDLVASDVLIEEYVAGRPWTDCDWTDDAALLSAGRHLLRALAYLHARGVVHRDIKPANLQVVGDRDGPLPVLLDFGFAARRELATEKSGSLGTVAPEVLADSHDPASADLFSLGTTLLAAGRSCDPDPRWSLDTKLLRAAAEELSRARPALSGLINGLCSAAPEDRFASAADAVAQLAPEQASTPAEAWPLVGRDALLDDVIGFVDSRAGQPAVVVLVGPSGSGRKRIARAVRLALRARGLARVRVALDVDSPDDPVVRELLSDTRGPVLVTTSSAAVAGRFASVLPDAAFRQVEVGPLDSRAVVELSRFVPLGSEANAVRLHERASGDPGAIAELVGSRDDTHADGGLAELYLAVRGERVAPDEVRDGNAPGEHDFEQAAEQGVIRRERDGSYTVRSRALAAERLARADLDVVRRLHGLAASRIADTAPGFAVHAAASGLVERLPGALAHVAQLAASGRAARAEETLSSLVRTCGRDAVLAADAELADAVRALVQASRLTRASEILSDVTPETCASSRLLAVRGFLVSEQGDPAAAVGLVEAALAIEPDAPVAVHLDLARARQFTGRFDAALECLDHALTLADGPRQRAEVQRVRMLVLFRLGCLDDAVAAGTSALVDCGSETSSLRMGILQNLALVERHRGQLDVAADLFADAADGLLALGDARGASIVWINSGIVLENLGRPEQSLEPRRRALRAAELDDLAQPREVARAGIGIALARLGAFPLAVEHLARAERGLAEQNLRREALLARAERLAAAAEVEPGEASRDNLRACLNDALAAQVAPAAAVAMIALTGTGEAPALGLTALRQILRSVDKGTGDLLRVALHGQVLEGDESRARTLAALHRLTGSPTRSARLRAHLMLAEHEHDRRARKKHGAAALALARHGDSPAEMIRVATSLIPVTSVRSRHYARIVRAVHRLERMPAPEKGNPLVTSWSRQLERLRDCAQSAGEPAHPAFLECVEPFVRINRELLETGDGPDCYRAILEEAMRVCSAARGLIVSQRFAGSEQIVISLCAGEGGYREQAFDYTKSLIDEVIETGKPKVTVNALEDPEWMHAVSVRQFGLVSIACVPIRAGDTVLGAMYLDNEFEAGNFRDNAVEVLEAFGTQLSIALAAARQRAEIARLNDELTDKLEVQREQLETAERELAELNGVRRVVYHSEKMARVMKQVRRLAAADLPVHIRGATGTGKELVARMLHERSSRRNGPFVSENCTAIAAEILESELFGHVAGAFTGATRDKPGLLRMAHEGTLFLDEIGDMPLSLQAKLLRVLQEGEVRPVGSGRVVPVDIRLVTATHRDLEQMVADGQFREDLFYRVVVTRIDLPTLAERREDIRLLASHFLERHGRPGQYLDPDALAALEAHSWPGNVRELESAICSATVTATGPRIMASDLPITISARAPASTGALPTINLKQLERLAIIDALEQAGGNRKNAAELLGISRSSVFAKIKDFGIQA